MLHIYFFSNIYKYNSHLLSNIIYSFNQIDKKHKFLKVKEFNIF